MVRTLIGGLVGGVVIFVLGFLFWATPLGQLAYARAGDPQNAAVQTALAQNLTQSGTGAYTIPAPDTAGGAVLYGRGPVATVFFNTSGYSREDMTMILPGFILAVVAGILLAFALAAAGDRSFAERARIVVGFALAFTAWEFLGAPLFNHYGWGFWIYTFVAETIVWIAAGLVIARWFLPRSARVAPFDAPATDAMAAE